MPRKKKIDNSLPLSDIIEQLLSTGKLELDMSNSDEVKRKFIPPPSKEEIDEELKWRMYYLEKRIKETKEQIAWLEASHPGQW
jgi:hypothetical protein